jgi:hypothetical protein
MGALQVASCGCGRDLAGDSLGAGQFRNAQIVRSLKIQPRACITAEISRQTHGCVSGWHSFQAD